METTTPRSIELVRQREDAIKKVKLSGLPVIWEDGGYSDVKLSMFPVVKLYSRDHQPTTIVLAVDDSGDSGVIAYTGAVYTHFVIKEKDGAIRCLSVYNEMRGRLDPGILQMKSMGFLFGIRSLKDINS